MPSKKTSRPSGRPQTNAAPKEVRRSVTPKDVMDGKKHRHGSHAGFLKDGSRMAFLEEVRDPSIPTRTLSDLSHTELVNLVLVRFDQRRFLPIRMLGVPGIVGKKRAIAEVQAGTRVGHHLMEIEKRFIRFQLERG